MAGGHKYLFLDEVQNVTGWERWVRRLCDTEDVEIFVTGSSSSLLTRDLSTSLRGRSITFEVFPLSFREYLSFRDIEVVMYDADNESLLRHELERYLLWGGFPEVVLADETLRQSILEEYGSVMLYRDVVERYGVLNEKLIRELLRHEFRNTSSLLNVSKLHRDFASQGFAVSKNTLFEYLGYLEDSFLVFLAPKQEPSLRKQAHNPKKLHVIDTGLISAFQAFPDRNLGHKLETIVFLQNRRQRKELFYYTNGSEVDLCDGEDEFFINTCWSLTEPETIRREKAAMVFGSARWPAAKSRLLYHEYSPGAEMKYRALCRHGAICLDEGMETEYGLIGAEIKDRQVVTSRDLRAMREVARSLGTQWREGMITYQRDEIRKLAEPSIWAVPSRRLFI